MEKDTLRVTAPLGKTIDGLPSLQVVTYLHWQQKYYLPIDSTCLNKTPLRIKASFPQRMKDLFLKFILFFFFFSSAESFSVLDMVFGSETLNQADVVLQGRDCKN